MLLKACIRLSLRTAGTQNQNDTASPSTLRLGPPIWTQIPDFPTDPRTRSERTASSGFPSRTHAESREQSRCGKSSVSGRVDTRRAITPGHHEDVRSPSRPACDRRPKPVVALYPRKVHSSTTAERLVGLYGSLEPDARRPTTTS